ncbi:MAG: FHA domain-containing protein [Ferruginibacter sp.]
MPNITLQNSEMVFLRESILQKYCDAINENVESFLKKLTGTLKHYEILSDIIMDYVGNGKNLLNYMNFLDESAFKIYLRKVLEEQEKNNKYKNMSDAPTVTANILRKLIFYGPLEDELVFKDFFVLACYIYIGADRNHQLKKLGSKKINASSTLKPQDYIVQTKNNTSGQTADPYRKTIKCTLVPIEEKNNASKKLDFNFRGASIPLNRMNLDPDNKTITSKTQATLYVKDNEWYIENNSELKTTFIQVLKPVKLEKGDIIIFGNKYFLFED